MLRDEYNQAVLEAIGCEYEFENDGSPLAVAIAEAHAGRDRGNTSVTDAAIDRIVEMLAAVPFPAPVRRIDEEREAYNLEILAQAIDFQSENGLLSADEELDAQIALIQATTGPAADHMVDHLRGMLEISYTEESELPEVPPARGEAPQIEQGSPHEVFEFTVRMTRAQINAVYQGLMTMVEYPNNQAEGRAAQILFGAIPSV